MDKTEFAIEKLSLIKWVSNLEDEDLLNQMTEIKKEYLQTLKKEVKQKILDCNDSETLQSIKMLIESHIELKQIR